MNETTFDKHRRTAFDGARWDSVFSSITAHVHSGDAFEESGDTDAAIDAYDAAIAEGEQCGLDMFHVYRHAYERIIALLRYSVRRSLLESYIDRYAAHPLDDETRTRINQIKQSI
ncbi:MAG: hypothetical protein NC401_10360 [Ruminococcus sp.]|nr:hypothetical protein [Ruminococcus sp.]MCM1438973.1 hypothetical protein [Roseburia sp.]